MCFYKSLKINKLKLLKTLKNFFKKYEKGWLSFGAQFFFFGGGFFSVAELLLWSLIVLN
jgi:hypothetical protein